MPNRYQIKIYFTISFLIINFICRAQQYKFQLLEQDYINRNTDCKKIYQDEFGMLWFATYHGAYKYDGVNIFPYLHDPNNRMSINHNLISDIDEDTENIYLTTWGGKEINCINKITGDINETKLNIIQNSTYSDLLCLGIGNVLAIGTGGLVYFSPKGAFKKIVELKGFSKLLGRDSKNNLLVMMADELLTYTIIKDDIMEKKRIKVINKISCIENIEQATVYGTSKGLFSDDTSIKFPVELSNLNILSLKYDSYKNLWIGTADSGLFCWNIVNNTIHHYESNDKNGYLHSNKIYYIFEDSKRLLWIATEKGIYFADLLPPKFKYFSFPKTIKVSNQTPMGIDKNGQLWVGNKDGILEFSLKNEKFGKLIFNIKNVSSLHFDKSKSNAYIGSETEGLFHYKFDDTSKNYKFLKHYKYNPKTQNSIQSNFITKILTTPDSSLWVGSYGNGFSVLTNDKIWKHFTKNEINGIASSDLLKVNDSIIWLTFYDSGLIKGKKQKNNKYDFTNIKSLGQNLCYEVITSITQDSKGHLWLSTFGGGITKYNPNNNEVICYTTVNGLPSNNIYSVECDSEDNIWCSTANGIAFIKSGANQFRSFNISDGLPQENFNFYSSCIISDSSIYFATKSEICNIETKKLSHIKPDVYRPVISNIKIFNEDIEIGDKKPISTIPHLVNKLFLHFDQDIFSIDFTNNYYRNPKQVTYSYYLEGFHDDWVNIGKNSTAFFTRLPAGDYKLYYRTSIDEGSNYDTCISPLNIIIRPPWYQTWWCRTIFVVMSAFGLWWLIKLRTQRLLEKQKIAIEKEHAVDAERKRIARDMHDDLGSGLSAIHLYSDYLRSNLAEQYPEISDEIQKIVLSSSELNQKVKEIIWSNENKMQSVSTVFQFLKKSYAELINSNQCNLQIGEISEENDLIMDANTSKNIYLCLKEAINNSIKYAQAKNLHVQFSIENGNSCFTVQDDGIGFSIPDVKLNGGRGLVNIKNRMNELHGSAEFYSSSEGTIVKFILKI